jgi:hypothetical protein
MKIRTQNKNYEYRSILVRDLRETKPTTCELRKDEVHTHIILCNSLFFSLEGRGEEQHPFPISCNTHASSGSRHNSYDLQRLMVLPPSGRLKVRERESLHPPLSPSAKSSETSRSSPPRTKHAFLM